MDDRLDPETVRTLHNPCPNLIRKLERDMKVLFSNPPWWAGTTMRRLNDGEEHEIWTGGIRAGSRWPFTTPMRCAPDHFQWGDYRPYPFFMGYAASYAARATGSDVRFRDSIALSESYASYFAHLRDERYDLIVIESATPSWTHDRGVIRALVEILPEVRIVVTGPIAARAETVLKAPNVVACVKGEYEKGVVRAIGGETGVIGHDLLTREEMNAAPFPWMDALHAHRYWDANPKGQAAPQAQVWSSRGCPFKCIFCVWPATMTGDDPDGTGKRSVRHYSAEYMEAHLRELVGRYDYKSIYFDDDTFNLGNSHVLRMCAVMERIGLPWSAMCRADTIRMETWRTMREAGCFGVKLGFESGNQWVVDNIVNKHLDLDYAASVVHELKRLGMTVHGTFTYGLPGETHEQMLDTKRFIASLPFDSYQESGTAEIEGTPLATLGEGRAVSGYDGAELSGEYRTDSDGARKWRALASELQGA